MKTIDLTRNPDPVRALQNAVLGIDGVKQNPPGTKIVYLQQETTWELWRSPVAKEAYRLYEIGACHLVQEIVSDSPRVYNYIAEVR